jgi:hypothetical protein
MCADDANGWSFDEVVRSIAREVGRSADRIRDFDVDEIAGNMGVDPTLARQWVDSAGSWLRAQAENLGEDVAFRTSGKAAAADEETLRGAAPHPLDLPTEEQGLALAALDSGRWTVEPGSNTLAAHGEGLRPTDALGLVRELHARDWIGTDGEVTLIGRHALRRWLDAAARA